MSFYERFLASFSIINAPIVYYDIDNDKTLLHHRSVTLEKTILVRRLGDRFHNVSTAFYYFCCLYEPVISRLNL